ncbi:MAG TPA: trypsin-like peptidase domain-containing protein [Candidatus Nanopelagicales bacterium]|nr:trypsin-like peptidase domain-containing protein [Candidatus Nanopelagicales bacterium]
MKKALWLVVACFAGASGLAGCVSDMDEGGEVAAPQEDLDTPEGELGIAPIKAGDVLEYLAETPHPYTSGWRHQISSPGATFVRVHLSGLDLAPGDYVTVSSPDGSQSHRYEGQGPNGDGDVWAFAIDGDAAVVELHAEAGGAHGFTIDTIGHGTLSLSELDGKGTGPSAKSQQPNEEVICGTDGRDDAACHPALDALQKPIARLLFSKSGSQYLCTGWLVAGSNQNSMLTNAHCFTTQTEVNSVEARFNYQRSSCGGSTNATTTSYTGGTLLKFSSDARKGKSGGLDYTLFTVQGDAEATWGEIIPTTKAAPVGTEILFIQHPGGRPKQIGYWEDDAQTIRCQLNAVDQSYGSATPGTQSGYGCDSEGGSSGSPILEAATGRAIALHHYGNVSTSTCLNGGTEMSAVCADAGSLLSCVSN